jgi:hypothetical protein
MQEARARDVMWHFLSRCNLCSKNAGTARSSSRKKRKTRTRVSMFLRGTSSAGVQRCFIGLDCFCFEHAAAVDLEPQRGSAPCRQSNPSAGSRAGSSGHAHTSQQARAAQRKDPRLFPAVVLRSVLCSETAYGRLVYLLKALWTGKVYVSRE